MAKRNKELGELILDQRTKFGYSQKYVAQKLGIDISLLCKIEHGERKVQGRMLKEISELFDLSYEKLQIEFLSKKILTEFSKEPFIIDAMENCISCLTKNKQKSVENQ
jgi:transcriptional regulator with XRE-family HTH domain